MDGQPRCRNSLHAKQNKMELYFWSANVTAGQGQQLNMFLFWFTAAGPTDVPPTRQIEGYQATCSYPSIVLRSSERSETVPICLASLDTAFLRLLAAVVTSSNCGTSFAWMNSSNWDKTQRLKSSECYKKTHKNSILVTLVFHPRLKPLIKHISLSLILTSLWRWISCVLAVEFPLIRPLICSCLRSYKNKKAEHDYFYDVTNADKKSVSSHLATI